MTDFGFIQAEDAAKLFSVSKSTWWRWVKRGVISGGVKLGYNRRGWAVDELRTVYELMKSGEVTL